MLNSILEALLNPKPNDQWKRHELDNYRFGHGLILIPVPSQPSTPRPNTHNNA